VTNVDDLYDEFCDYKTDEDIGRDAWNEAKVVVAMLMERR